jgi:hypothetical protein
MLDNEKMTSFVKPADYGIEEISKVNEKSLSRVSSASSIGNIEEEMIRRNLLPPDGFDCKDSDDDMHTTPTATQQVIKCPKSPVRKPPQSRIVIKTPEKLKIQIEATTPTKKKTVKTVEGPESPKSNDTLSGIQEIDKEPKEDFGLKWVPSMYKRDGQSKNLVSSSSSSEKGSSIRIDIGNDSSSSSTATSTGAPMNLRQFLIRELNQRSFRDKSSSDESSLSSQFMRSLLNASGARHGTSSGNTSTNERLRTSTPVITKGSSSQFPTQKSGGTSLFPGESLSTLKGDSDKSDDKQS